MRIDQTVMKVLFDAVATCRQQCKCDDDIAFRADESVRQGQAED